MMTQLRSHCSFGCCFFLVLIAQVAGGPQSGSAAADNELFSTLDSNEDDVLSGKEVKGLEKYDADSDGEVSRKEFDQGRAAVGRKLPGPNKAELARLALEKFRLLDTNEDGRLSGTEMVGFEKLDGDGDRRVAEKEFIAGFSSIRTETTEGEPGSLLPEQHKPAEFKWVKVPATAEGVTFEMPGNPTRTAVENQPIVRYRLQAADTWTVRIETHKEDVESSAEGFFKAIQRDLVAALESEPIDSEQADAGNHPGRVFFFKAQNGDFFVERTVLIGPRIYRFQVLTSESDQRQREKVVNHFFESAGFPETDDDVPAPPTDAPSRTPVKMPILTEPPPAL